MVRPDGVAQALTTLLELAAEHDTIAAAGRRIFEGWHGVLAAKLEAQGVSPRRAMRLARTATAALRGALILARTERSAAAIEEAGEELACCSTIRSGR